MHTLLMILTVIPIASPDQNGDNSAATLNALETEVLEIMGTANTTDLARIAQHIETLAPELRCEFPIRVRRNTIEWRFEGEHPADQLSPQMLEYVVSSKAKDYETLIVVDAEQVERAKRLGATLERLRQRSPNLQLEVRLAWSTNDGVRIVRLWDILSGESQRTRRKFLLQLASTDEGLAAFNAKADKTELPASRVAAQVYVTVRMPGRQTPPRPPTTEQGQCDIRRAP